MNVKYLFKSKAHVRNGDAGAAHNHLVTLGSVTVQLSGIARAPRYPDGRRENDTEHSFHLAVSATELAATYFPRLDPGLVAQLSLVHDMPEIYAGDVWTFGITEADLEKKAQDEMNATDRLLGELPPHTAQLLRRYHAQQEPEARFVRFVDKLLPSIINVLAGDSNTFKEDFGYSKLEDMDLDLSERKKRLQALFPEFEFIHFIDELVHESANNTIFRS